MNNFHLRLVYKFCDFSLFHNVCKNVSLIYTTFSPTTRVMHVFSQSFKPYHLSSGYDLSLLRFH